MDYEVILRSTVIVFVPGAKDRIEAIDLAKDHVSSFTFRQNIHDVECDELATVGDAETCRNCADECVPEMSP